MPNLSDAIQEYKSALDAASAAAGSGASTLVAKVLLARDAVARGLEAGEGAGLSPADLQLLVAQDGLLKGKAKDYANAVGSKTLADWRAAYGPKAEAWWWRLDVPEEKEEAESSKLFLLLWVVIAGVLLAVAVSLAIDTFLRVRGGEQSLWETFGGSLSIVFTLLAGTSLLEILRQFVEKLLRRSSRSRYFWAAGALVAAVAVVAVYSYRGWALSRASAEFTSQLVDAYTTESDREAIKTGEQSLAIDPANRDAAFTAFLTAVAYERSGKPDEAIEQFLRHKKLSPNDCRSFNSIARIFLRRGDYTNAGRYLEHLIRPCGEDDETQTNLGWAALLVNDYDGAQGNLEHAIRIRLKGNPKETGVKAPHCLLAQVLEAQREVRAKVGKGATPRPAPPPAAAAEGEQAAIDEQWGQCVKLGVKDEVEAEWVKLAHQRLTEARAARELKPRP